MEYSDYIKTKNRMTQYDGICIIPCKDCPLALTNNKYMISCMDLEIQQPKEAEKIVQKWADEHPIKTRQQALLEVFPDAPMNGDFVDVCPSHVDKKFSNTVSNGTCNGKCKECRRAYWHGEY